MRQNLQTYRIAYLCIGNPLDRRRNSGTQRFMVDALRGQGNQVYPIFPEDFISTSIFKILYKVYALFFTNRSLYFNSRVYSKFLGAYFSLSLFLRRLLLKKYDLIFVSRGSVIIPYLKTSLPIVYTSDATFWLMIDYYDRFTEYDDEQIKAGDWVEQMAIHKSRKLIYPSAWAADSATAHYKAALDKVAVVPSGANFLMQDVPSMANLNARTQCDSCRLLFVGRDWQVKGGAIALKVANLLKESGIDVLMTVVGCIPPIQDLPSWVTVEPYLDKNNTSDFKKLSAIYLESHFLVVPTRNETFGLVFTEACAFGLPIISTTTGGVPSIVENGVNGYLFPIDSDCADIADAVRKVWCDPLIYNQFSQNSRKKYEEVFNWNTWGGAVQRHLDQIFDSDQ